MSLFESASLVVTPNGTKASKLYAIKPTDGSGDLTVVRATTATRVNSSGLIESVASNIPRLDYTNSTCPSILVEPQRTNVTQRSEEFDNGYWVKTNSDIISNSVIAPDGNLTADTFSDMVLTNQSYTIRRNQSYTSGTTYTSSFFAKNLNRRYVYMRFVSSVFGTNKYAFFDLQLGTVISADSGVIAEIINYGNGWFRCIATSTASVTTSTASGILIGLSDNGVNVEYINPSVKSIYIWGAQLEAGSYSTSYIPTTTASVTRNADVISKTGISSLIGQTEGTIFVDCKNVKVGLSRLFEIFNLSNTGTNIFLNLSSSGALQIVLNGSTVNTATGNVVDLDKVIFKYTAGSIKLFNNGVLIGSYSGAVSFSNALDTLAIGGTTYTTRTINGNIKLVGLWKTALTDQECINLTTI